MKREVLRARVRTVARGASLAAVVALSALGTLLLVRAPRPTYVQIERVPVVIAIPAPARRAVIARAVVPRRIGCSLPVSQIGLAGG